MWEISKALLHAFQHQVADIIAAVPGRAGDPADGFVITAIQGEGYAQFGAVLEAELKAVRAPTRTLITWKGCSTLARSCALAYSILRLTWYG